MRRTGLARIVLITVAVALSAGACSSKRKEKHVPQPLQITTTSLPDAVEGTPYSYTVTASGGNPANYNWSISGQPLWLSIDAATGELSGTPPTGSASIYTFTVEVTDGQQTASKQFDLTVRLGGSLTITTIALPYATEGVSYKATIKATGGAPPYTWSVNGLPSGLTWSQVRDHVEINGIPASGTAGTYSVDVTVTDSSSPAQSDNATFRLVVNPAGGTTLKADFEASPAYGIAPLTVNFTDKSTGNPTSWEWDFNNDGIVDSTDQNPSCTYNNTGWYTVKLTVSDGTDTDTCVKEMYVLVADNIWYVNGDGGDDTNGGTGWSDAFATIGKALSAADDYDLILVADATYNETNLDFGGRKIYLKGVDHNTAGAQPVIDCQQAGRAFHFGSGETKESVIDNFTIKNGSADTGGAIYCESSSPTVTNCTFSGNSVNSYDRSGGAIYCYQSSPSIANCTFSGNSAGSYGGGGAIYCNQSSPNISNCTFTGNSGGVYGGGGFCGGGGAIWCCNYSSPTITNCIFSGNSATFGGAICCYNFSNPVIINCTFCGNSSTYSGAALNSESSSNMKITNCTFSNNSANLYGGAIFCYDSGSVTLNNCILWGNSAGSAGDGIYTWDSGSSCTLNYCCVDSTGNISRTGSSNILEYSCIYVNPQFLDPANGDYRLRSTSPCIDAGNNSLVAGNVDKDLDGNPRIVDGDNDGTATVDIGAYEYQP